MNHDIQDVVIIGGGITGLATAYYLQEQARISHLPLRYTLIESSDRLGGKITTEKVDGFTIEGGPDCFLSQKPWAADLCASLGLHTELVGTNDERRKVFVLNRGQLTALPDGVMLIIPTRIMPFLTSRLISWPGKLRMGLDLLLPRGDGHADESIASFVRRRLGNEALNKIAEPLLSGIHVSDAEEQSLLGTFPRFRDLEVKHRSLILGMLSQKRRRGGASTHGGGVRTAGPQRPASIFITLRGGLEQLVTRLADNLTGEITKGTQIVAVHLVRQPDGDHYLIHSADGRAWRARALVIATPAYVASRLVESFDSQLAAALARIRYVSTATISMGYRQDELNHPLDGFGFVIPKREGRLISACTWTSTKFNHRAPEQQALVRCFVGGPDREELVHLPDSELLSLARRELSQIMGVRGEPSVTRIFRWHKANPQYDVGHPERVRALQDACSAHPGLYITGSAYEGVGIPDCVRQGQSAARAAAAYLASGASEAAKSNAFTLS